MTLQVGLLWQAVPKDAFFHVVVSKKHPILWLLGLRFRGLGFGALQEAMGKRGLSFFRFRAATVLRVWFLRVQN